MYRYTLPDIIELNQNGAHPTSAQLLSSFIHACKQQDIIRCYDIINIPTFNINDHGYETLKCAINFDSERVVELLLGDARTDPNQNDGLLFVEALKQNNLPIITYFLRHHQFNPDTFSIKEALLSGEYADNIVNVVLDDPRVVIDRQNSLFHRGYRFNDVSSMDIDALNKLGIIGEPFELDTNQNSAHFVNKYVDGLRSEFISVAYEENLLDEREMTFLTNHSSFFDYIEEDRVAIDKSYNGAGIPLFDNLNRYTKAMLIMLTLEFRSDVLELLQSLVPLGVGDEIAYWVTNRVAVK